MENCYKACEKGMFKCARDLQKDKEVDGIKRNVSQFIGGGTMLRLGRIQW